MAENENRNTANPTININVPGGTPVPEGAALLSFVVELFRKSGLQYQEIRDLLANLDNLPSTEDIESLNENLKKSISKSVIAAKNAIIKKIEELSKNGAVDNSAEIAKLQESLDRIEQNFQGKLDNLSTDEKEKNELIRSLIGIVSELEKRVGELVEDHKNPPAPIGNKDEKKDGPSGDHPVGDPSDPTSDDKKDPKHKKDKKPEDVVPVEIHDEPQDKLKLKKMQFVQKSLKKTKILSEPRKAPWYKRLATFAIKHPVLSVLAGTGLGLGAFAVTCGISAVAGGAGFATAVNMLIPSIPGFAGIGALAGGATSIVSNVLPQGAWGLYAKSKRQFAKVKKIDKAKQWVANFESSQEKAKESSREKHKNSRGLVRKLKIHRKVAKVHKLAERTARKVGKLFGRQLVKSTSKALETKSKLNTKEISSGKTQALAGYLQKRKNAENKFLNDEMSSEDLDEKLEDLDEDFSDLDGGEEGLQEVGNQYTFDAEALEVIDLVDADGKNKAFQAVKKDILTRNTREARSIGTKVVLDPDYLRSVIEDMKKKGETENLAKYERELATIMAQAEEVKAEAAAYGVEDYDPFKDLTEEEIAQLEKDITDNTL